MINLFTAYVLVSSFAITIVVGGAAKAVGQLIGFSLGGLMVASMYLALSLVNG